MENITIRLEAEKDYRAVEELNREAFWNVYTPGASEHYYVHMMRNHPDFIPELAFVLEKDGKIIGNIMYTKAWLKDESGERKEILSSQIGKTVKERKKDLCRKGVEYIDFIMPQIYYGFYNETKPYKDVLEEWESIIKNKKVDFRVALAFYKVGSHDKWAKSGENEWIDANDIIMRQIVLVRNTYNYKGFSLYRYEYLFETDYFTDTTLIEKENIKKVLN